MADRPSDLPRWATDAGSRVEPPEGKKDTGWTEGELPPAGFFNWLFGRIYDWFAWLESLLEIPAESEPGALSVQRLRARQVEGTGALTVGDAPGVRGKGAGVGAGVLGEGAGGGIGAPVGPGVVGIGGSRTGGTPGDGVLGEGFRGVYGKGVGGAGAIGVRGDGGAFGVFGHGGDLAGVFGQGDTDAPGVMGDASGTGPGVLGNGSATAPGVRGVSGGGPGVEGRATAANVAAVHGETSHHEGIAVRARGWHEAAQAPIGTGLVASGTKGVVGSGTFIGVQAEGVQGGIPLVVAAQAQPTVNPPQVPKGAIYFDNASNTLKVFDGTAWRTVQTT